MSLLPLLLMFAAETEPLRPGDHTRSLKIGEKTRTYHVHIPKDHDPKKPTPVVLALHGAGMNGLMMQLYSGLNRKADEAGFIVVYPDGTGVNRTFLTWNAGGFRGLSGNVNDVEFLGKVLDELAMLVKTDPKRIYAAGMSNGAMMSYRLAGEMSDRIAAIAPVAGTMALPKAEPKRPVSVIHFHGTVDTLVPYKGLGRSAFMSIKGVDDSVEAWAKLNGCKDMPETSEVNEGKTDLKVTRKTWSGGKEGSEVVLYIIDGGGHTWPGGKFNPGLLGKTAKDLPANDFIWEFFKKHPMK